VYCRIFIPNYFMDSGYKRYGLFGVSLSFYFGLYGFIILFFGFTLVTCRVLFHGSAGFLFLIYFMEQYARFSYLPEFFTSHNRANGFRNCFSPQTAIKRAQNAYARKATKKQLQRNALAATPRTPAKKASLT
jgi:hypothetical protein